MKLSSVLSFALLATASAFTSRHVNFAANNHVQRASSTSLNMVADDAKVILITGSSRGLGKSIALEMARHGQKIVVNYVSDSSKDAAEQTKKEIEELGAEAIVVQADSKLKLFLCTISSFQNNWFLRFSNDGAE